MWTRCGLAVYSPYDVRTGKWPLTSTFVVETIGLEPTTPCLQSRCSSQLSYVPWIVESRTSGYPQRTCRVPVRADAAGQRRDGDRVDPAGVATPRVDTTGHDRTRAVVGSQTLDEVREAAAFVAEHAGSVAIDETRLRTVAEDLVPLLRKGLTLDATYFYRGDPKATLAYVVTLNAVNFGSGWWPHLVKIPGQSGSITMMSRLRDRFSSAGPLSAEELATITVPQCAELFGQPLRSPIDDLMAHFAGRCTSWESSSSSTMTGPSRRWWKRRAGAPSASSTSCSPC